ncbi:hypothetical protein NQ317_002748 [Molorchus minor]|uniref:Uncharacterized protein n=1 Tax=Molorchus minor TaxID=1323400 RepID=A0ABQ9K5M2_9CUCU|nr:hypothetical protein NQ317_002748 [Molorchus minor]
MEPNNNKIDVDPDYKINNIALRKIEEKDNKLTCDRVSKIIGDEFEKELAIREKQLEEIEEKIYKAQKLLHLVRYVLITSYYNRNGLECNGASTEYSAVLRFNDQGRIHPAVKKLLSGNMSLELLHARGKRKPSNRHTSNDFSTSHLHTTKKIKLEAQDPMERISNPLIIDHQHLLKSRKRSRYRIVVGNISKWMPSLENDNTTHKWMGHKKMHPIYLILLAKLYFTYIHHISHMMSLKSAVIHFTLLEEVGGNFHSVYRYSLNLFLINQLVLSTI